MFITNGYSVRLMDENDSAGPIIRLYCDKIDHEKQLVIICDNNWRYCRLGIFDNLYRWISRHYVKESSEIISWGTILLFELEAVSVASLSLATFATRSKTGLIAPFPTVLPSYQRKMNNSRYFLLLWEAISIKEFLDWSFLQLQARQPNRCWPTLTLTFIAGSLFSASC